MSLLLSSRMMRPQAHTLNSSQSMARNTKTD
jgi:hypothetical protein